MAAADVNYDPSIYEVDTLDAAKNIILRPQHGVPTDQRWQVETEWTLRRLKFPEGALIFDIGCGVGRLAKPLVERGHYVVGVDTSQSMRDFAHDYVADARFSALSPDQFIARIKTGLMGDGAIALWVLQHIPPEPLCQLIAALRDGLEPRSLLFTLDRPERWIPIKGDSKDDKLSWHNDRFDVPLMLRRGGFELEAAVEPPLTCCKAGAAFRQWRRR